MLKFCSLYSGSTGNSLYLESENTKILVDAGVSAKKIVSALTSLDVNIEDIDSILVTHEHSDHIKSLGTISKKFDIPVYANTKTWDAMKEQKDKISSKNQFEFNNSEVFEINDLKIYPFDIPHDAANPCGFNIYNKKAKLSIATDLGHMTNKIISNLDGSSFIMLEANYEPEVLKCCSYPYYLKNRIAGPNGHLSNNTAGKTIATLMHSGLKEVLLGHLSKESNFPELAHKTVVSELQDYSYSEDELKISVASRIEPSKLIEVC